MKMRLSSKRRNRCGYHGRNTLIRTCIVIIYDRGISCIPHKVLVADGQPSYGSMYGPVITGSQNVRIDILRYALHPYNSISVPFDSPSMME
ncbi:MAG: hypothetical protein VX435_12495 [Planctomycetota bacterium]|nr:hypothetical protein [Planctomycetota bacterium]